MNTSAEPEKQSQNKPNLSLPKGDQTQLVVSLSNLFQRQKNPGFPKSKFVSLSLSVYILPFLVVGRGFQ